MSDEWMPPIYVAGRWLLRRLLLIVWDHGEHGHCVPLRLARRLTR